MTDYTLFSSQSVSAQTRVVSSTTGDDLTEYEKEVSVTTTGDTTIYMQYTTDGGSTYTTVRSVRLDSGTKTFYIFCPGKIRAVADNNESSSSITLDLTVTTSVYATDYCSPEHVVKLMQLRDNDGNQLSLSTSSVPTRNEVIFLIWEWEDYIDQRTGHAWREKTVENELHDYILPRHVGYHSRYYDNQAVVLKHRSIRTFNKNQDKLEVWDGGSWVDYLSSYTEGKSDDFYVDYPRGIIYFRSQKPRILDNSVRVTYRYGEDTVPNDIRMATAKGAALDLYLSNDYTSIIPSESGNVGIGRKIDKWQADIERVIAARKEM